MEYSMNDRTMMTLSTIAALLFFAGGANAVDPPPKLRGSLTMNYLVKDFDKSNKKKSGEWQLTRFELGVDGESNDILLSAKYRWYSGMHCIHHGWMGYNFGEDTQAQLGVTRVPFGILPYASHSYWEGIPYSLGFEDDFDMGIKLIHGDGPWDLRLAFFKSGEWGDASNLDRYSCDVVKDEVNFPAHLNEEVNQFNARLAYTIAHHETGSSELGLSGQWGQLYNAATESHGDRWAGAVHLDGRYGPLKLMLEAIRYEFNPDNPTSVSVAGNTGSSAVSVDDRFILMGSFQDAYEVAARGTILVANLGYVLPVRTKPVNKVTLYNDYSILLKDESGFADSQLNTIGCEIDADPVFVFLDVIMGNNALYIGGPADSFGRGGDHEGWHTRFNINIGYYF